MESEEGTDTTSLMVNSEERSYGNLNEESSKDDIPVTRRWEIQNDKGERTLNLVLVVEDIRITYYLTVIFILILGIIITKAVVKEDYSAIIRDVFGASNVCVYLDFPPATYVMPILWCFAVIFGVLYAAIAILRIYVAHLENKLSRTAFILLIVAYVYVGFSIMLFTEIFAVQPDREVPETMIIHSFAYLNLKIMLSVLQVVITYFGIKVSWQGLNLPRWFRTASIVHAVTLILVSAYSLVFAVNALGDMGEKDLVGKGLMWSVKSKASTLSGEIIVNALGTILGLVLPLIQAIFISRHGIKSHALVVKIGDNRMGIC